MIRVATSRRARVLAVPVLLVLAASGSGQDTASTLSAMAERADVVAVADLVAPPNGNAGTLTARFVVRSTLKGAAPQLIELSEPAGHACGRALTGVRGRTMLFLQMVDGELELVVSNSRSIVPYSDALRRHVAGLVAARRPEERLSALAEGLGSPERRVRGDAALALPYAPGLEAADAAVRTRVGAALDRALAVEPDGLPALLLAAERLRLTSARPSVVGHYLAGTHTDADRLLRRVIPSLGAEEAAQLIADRLPSNATGRRRAAELLQVLPPVAARPGLVALLTVDDAAARIAARGLLDDGVAPQWLAQRCSAEVLAAARGRVPAAPVFRAIRPEKSR